MIRWLSAGAPPPPYHGMVPLCQRQSKHPLAPPPVASTNKSPHTTRGRGAKHPPQQEGGAAAPPLTTISGWRGDGPLTTLQIYVYKHKMYV